MCGQWVTDLEVAIHRMEEEAAEKERTWKAVIQRMKDEVAKKERTWKALEEKLANKAASTYGLGFKVALEHVRLLCPSTDVSATDAGKVVVDG